MTLEDLEAIASPAIINRGRRYWNEGYVRFMQAYEDQLKGIVTGTLGNYQVTVEWNDGGLRGQCDCPYQRGFCKHATALVWGWLNHPESFLSHAQIMAAVDGLSVVQMREALRELSISAPEALASTLGIWRTEEVTEVGIIRCLAENLETKRAQRPEWLSAWRRVLELLDGKEQELEIVNRLIAVGVTYLRESGAIDPDFVELFGKAFQSWSQSTSQIGEELPDWWNDGWAALLGLNGEIRRQIRHIIIESIGAWGVAMLLTLGYPPGLEQESFEAGIDFVVGWLLQTGSDLQPVKEWAFFRLERVLQLMDLLAEEEAWNLLKDLAKEGLRCSAPSDKFIFRSRLAQAHRKLGEPRQALPHLVRNYQERPGLGEYLELAETAKEAGEPGRALKVAQTALRNGRVEVLAQILIQENAFLELLELAPEIPSESPVIHKVALTLRTMSPASSITLWERHALAFLDNGTRRGVKEAMLSLVEIKRLCRELEYNTNWEKVREAALAKILDPVALEMTASILAPLAITASSVGEER